MRRLDLNQPERGSTLVEVLVTFMVLAIGLMGMAGLLLQLQSAELESYQRSQAIMILKDMENRVSLNYLNVPAYAAITKDAASPVGVDIGDCGGMPNGTQAERDMRDWCYALQGAGETTAGTNVGAMIGGRGCVEALGAANTYMITVAWQGVTPTVPPPASVTCGANLYDNGTNCVADLCRRTVTTVVRVAAL